MYPHWNARDNYRYGLKKKKRKRDKSDDPGTCHFPEKANPLLFFIFVSGTLCLARRSRSTTRWRERSGRCTCSSTRAGLPGTTTRSTKRNEGKGIKLETEVVATKYVWGPKLFVCCLLKYLTFRMSGDKCRIVLKITTL